MPKQRLRAPANKVFSKLLAVADAKAVLASEFEKHGLSAEIEVYEDAMHGWCVLDSPVYNHSPAEKAWARTLALFSEAL